MNIDITQALVAFIGLIGVIITSVIIPYFKSKTTKEQWDTIRAWTKTAVNAFETIYNGAGRGEEKKEAVKEYLEKMCADKGIKIDADTIDLAIQDAWDMLGLNKNKMYAKI